MDRHPHTTPGYIEVLPIGEVDDDILRCIAQVIERKFGLPASIGSALLAELAAFDSARDQYNAMTILGWVKEVRSTDARKTLSVIDYDIFSPGLNYIFGQAVLGGCCGVVSLTRLRQGIGNPEGSPRFLARVEKEVVHELGHAFGLRHCPNPKCVMYFSSNIADTDRKSADFCSECGVPAV